MKGLLLADAETWSKEGHCHAAVVPDALAFIHQRGGVRERLQHGDEPPLHLLNLLLSRKGCNLWVSCQAEQIGPFASGELKGIADANQCGLLRFNLIPFNLAYWCLVGSASQGQVLLRPWTCWNVVAAGAAENER